MRFKPIRVMFLPYGLTFSWKRLTSLCEEQGKIFFPPNCSSLWRGSRCSRYYVRSMVIKLKIEIMCCSPALLPVYLGGCLQLVRTVHPDAGRNHEPLKSPGYEYSATKKPRCTGGGVLRFSLGTMESEEHDSYEGKEMASASCRIRYSKALYYLWISSRRSKSLIPSWTTTWVMHPFLP